MDPNNFIKESPRKQVSKGLVHFEGPPAGPWATPKLSFLLTCGLHGLPLFTRNPDALTPPQFLYKSPKIPPLHFVRTPGHIRVQRARPVNELARCPAASETSTATRAMRSSKSSKHLTWTRVPRVQRVPLDGDLGASNDALTYITLKC